MMLGSLFFLSASILVSNLSAGLIVKENYVYKPGRILLGFLSDSSPLKPLHTQYIYSFVRTMDVYSDQTQLNDEVDIGYVVVFLQSVEKMTPTLWKVLREHPNIIAFVGLHKSSSLEILASTVKTLKIPTFVVSSSITTDYIIKYANLNGHIVPLTTTATHQCEVIIPSILRYMGADIVSTICEDTKYSAPMLPIAIRSLESNGIDLESSRLLAQGPDGTIDFSPISELYREIKDANRKNRRAVIVSLLGRKSLDLLLARLLQISQTVNEPLDVLIVSRSSGCSSQISLEMIKQGIHLLRSCQTMIQTKDLVDYFKNSAKLWRDGEEKTILDPVLKGSEFETSCSPRNNTCFREILSSSRFSSYNYRIESAVRLVLEGLKEANPMLLRVHANRSDWMEPINSDLADGIVNFVKLSSTPESLSNVEEMSDWKIRWRSIQLTMEYFFDDNPDAILWGPHRANLKETTALKEYVANSTKGRLKCSEDCQPGYQVFKDPTDEAFLNCWTCKKCQGNHYTNEVNAATCAGCPENSWATQNKTTCSTETTSLHLTKTTNGMIVLSIIAVSTASIVITFGLYIQLWKKAVIVASGRDMAVIMYLGMICGLITSASIASTPESGICITIQIASHLLATLTIAPLLVKISRVLLIFKFPKKIRTKIKYFKGKYAYLQMLAIMMPMMISLLYGLADPKFRFKVYPKEQGYENEVFKVTASCKPKSYALVYFLLGLVIGLLFLATVMGFLTRNLPDNYNESLHVYVCSVATLAQVLCYVPAMILIPGQKQVFALAVMMSLLPAIINATIFIPKIYMCLTTAPSNVYKQGKVSIAEAQ